MTRAAQTAGDLGRSRLATLIEESLDLMRQSVPEWETKPQVYRSAKRELDDQWVLREHDMTLQEFMSLVAESVALPKRQLSDRYPRLKRLYARVTKWHKLHPLTPERRQEAVAEIMARYRAAAQRARNSPQVNVPDVPE
jgi:hypothetical protein